MVRLSSKQEDHPEAEYQFDKQLTLISGKAGDLRLVASATDVSGNTSAKVEATPPRRRTAKSAEEALAQGVEIVTEHFSLQGNYPNPFNPATTIVYNLTQASAVRLAVYNVLGQQIRVLVEEVQGAGGYAVEWNGLDEAGQSVAGGIYFYQLQAGAQQATGRMLFLK